MALKEPQFRSSGDPMEESDAEELEELEADAKDMAQKLLHYRTTLPVQLKSTFTSILSSQRPPFLEFVSGSDLESKIFSARDKKSRISRLIEASINV